MYCLFERGNKTIVSVLIRVKYSFVRQFTKEFTFQPRFISLQREVFRKTLSQFGLKMHSKAPRYQIDLKKC